MRCWRKAMNRTDAIELMQLSIDGETSPEQEAQLRDLLASSAEYRSIYDGLRDLARKLDSVPLLDPPGVRSSVLSRISPSVVSIRRPRRVILALAYAAAVVIIVGIAVHRA